MADKLLKLIGTVTEVITRTSSGGFPQWITVFATDKGEMASHITFHDGVWKNSAGEESTAAQVQAEHFSALLDVDIARMIGEFDDVGQMLVGMTCPLSLDKANSLDDEGEVVTEYSIDNAHWIPPSTLGNAAAATMLGSLIS
jgi:hypothetical protein